MVLQLENHNTAQYSCTCMVLQLENHNTAQHSCTCNTFTNLYIIWDDDVIKRKKNDVFGVIDLSKFIIIIIII